MHVLQHKTLGVPESVIGFRYLEETEVELDFRLLKQWVSNKLVEWYEKHSQHQQSLFNLTRPIKIKIFWKGELVHTLMQKRMTKDRIKREEDVPFQLKNCMYILGPYKEKSLDKKEIIRPLESIDLQKAFNSIEYLNRERTKYGTPVIYTGWTN